MTSKFFRRLACLAVLAFGTAPLHAQSQANPGDQSMEHAQIQATIDQSTAAVSAHDLDGILAAPRGLPQIEVTFDIDANGILHVC